MEGTELPKACARCQRDSEQFQTVDAGLRLALKSMPNNDNLPPIVCQDCYSELTSLVSQGMKLRAETEQREKNKALLWKNRVHLIKQARQHMIHKTYSEAAISYEKYLRVLELVYNKKNGELTPDIFNNSTRSKELTVITTVYWDLMRIYDNYPQYEQKMTDASQKLAQFISFSSVYPDILRKAEVFQRSAKNQAVVKSFLRATKGRDTRCFIATAAFQNPHAPEIQILRDIRDRKLKKSRWGRQTIAVYYKISPRLADWIWRTAWIRPPLRMAIRLTAHCLKNHVEKSCDLRDLSDHVES